MKEELAKSLIERSTITTSEDFTDKLLLKIEEAQSEPGTSISRIQSLSYPMMAIIVGGIVCFIVLFTGFLPKVEVFDYQFQLHKTPFMVMLVFTLLMGANHVLKLHDSFNKNY